MNLTTQIDPRRIWFHLDPVYYLQECFRAGVAVDDSSPAGLSAHFNIIGQRERLSPNRFFSDSFYRLRHPDSAAAVEKGSFASAFEHFVSAGSQRGYSPSPLFDASFYRARSGGLEEGELKFHGLADYYSHYLAIGIGRQIPGSWLFSWHAQVKASQAGPQNWRVLNEMMADDGTWEEWLEPVFRASWFRVKYDAEGTTAKICETYLGGARRYSPSPEFDEAFYTSTYSDVAGEVESGIYSCGYQHFLLFGLAEGRQPFPGFDIHHYQAANQRAYAAAKKQGLPPFLHFVAERKRQALSFKRDFADLPVAEDSGKAIYERRARICADVVDLSIDPKREKAASVIIVSRDKYEETFQCIASVLQGNSAAIEVILYDNNSTDGISDIENTIPGIKVIHGEANAGFTIPVNLAARMAESPILVLINNDVIVEAGAIDRAIQRLNNNESIGAVGGRIIRTHGVLQEGGSLVWRDGTCLGYGRDLQPRDGRVDFVRDVDFCSGCFLAVRKADWEALGGFDEAFAPAYYEESDFCLRVRDAGKRVLYDPKIVVHHFEFGSSTLPDDALALMRRNQRLFAKKHRSYLADALMPSTANIEAARLRLAPHPRVLFVEDEIPQPAKGMGYVRSSCIVSYLEEIAGHLTVVGAHPRDARIRWSRTGWRETTEILRDVNNTNFIEFLRARNGVYDVLWLSRTHNLRFLKAWYAAVPQFFANMRVILDTEAVAAGRRLHQSRLLGQDIDIDAFMREECAGMEIATDVIVVNEFDRSLIAHHVADVGRISVLGHAVEVQPRQDDFKSTSGLLIAGSLSNPHGPNADALRWFDREVYPALANRSRPIEITVAGFQAAEFISESRLQGSYEVISDVKDFGSLYKRFRLAVAPTRFAGGIPYKVHEAAAYGTPVIMSQLLAEQLGWTVDSRLGVVGSGEPQDWISAIDRLYSERRSWLQCRLAQYEHVQEDCDPDRYKESIRTLIQETS